MKARCRSTFLLLALFSVCFPLQANWWDDITSCFTARERPGPLSIRVLLFHDVESASLQVDGKYSLFDPNKKEGDWDWHVSTRFSGKKRTIQALSDGLKWGEAFPKIHQLEIVPREASTQIILNGQLHESPVYIYGIEGKTISAVVDVPLEDYVSAMLASYQHLRLEPEALAALAIVIRTNAYYHTYNPKNPFWAVDGQKVGYKGVVSLAPRQMEAIRQTRNMILSKTGIYEGTATPFAAQFDFGSKETTSKDVEFSRISMDEANAMAQRGEHAAQILAQAFPGAMIMLMQKSR